MRRASILALPLALFGAAFGQSLPRALVVQEHVPNTRDGDTNVPVAIELSKELDDGGRVTTVAWDMTDPIFREAIANRKIFLKDAPNERDIVTGARALGAEYIIVFTAYRAAGSVKSDVRLYHQGRVAWRDRESMAVDRAGAYDAESSAQSVARTIVLKMNQTVLRTLAVVPRARTPEPAPGQSPVLVELPPAPTIPTDDAALQAQVDGMLKNGGYASAVATLRDAIDTAPFDAKRRTMLIQTLLDRDPEHAAVEAQRAALLLPDHGEFRLMAARAWMQAGNAKAAKDELNEAVAHAPDAAATRLLLAQVALENLDAERALPHVEAAIKSEPSAEAYFLRAVCRALLGGVDGMKMDLDAMAKAEPKESDGDMVRRHRFAVAVFDQVMAHDSTEIRDVIQKAAIKPKDADLRQELATAQKRIAARVAFMEMLAVPTAMQRCHDRWLLADKLLAQSLVDVQTFIGGAEDALTDARMNLGEGIKQAEFARKM